ncbi:hypothetical protein [Micromonospora sp. NPDC049282]|uniref:hypothetical protein n=1 Tax=Micromonospora sp. NPDC049282 TaxID=3364269 RepID=UPI00371E2F58
MRLCEKPGEADRRDSPGHVGLSIIAPTEIVVDLADVAFDSSALPNFLGWAYLPLAADSTLVVCRPGGSALRLLRITKMEEMVTLRADLPVYWTPSGARLVTLPPFGGVD